jgi:hypothetical protein
MLLAEILFVVENHGLHGSLLQAAPEILKTLISGLQTNRDVTTQLTSI